MYLGARPNLASRGWLGSLGSRGAMPSDSNSIIKSLDPGGGAQ